MKFIQFLTISLVILLVNTFNVQISSSNKIKRRQSMMEYMNKFFSEDGDRGKKLSNFASTEHKSNNKHRFMEKTKKQDLVPDEPSDSPAPASGDANKAAPATPATPAATPANTPADSPAATPAATTAGTPAATPSNTPATNPGTPTPSSTSTTSENNPIKTTSPNLPPIVTSKPDSPDVLLGEYFMISSAAFKDTRRFPPIQMRDGSTIIIPVDERLFRINDAHNKPDNSDKLPSNKFFWFRLSGLNLYYTTTKTDINILGSVRIESIDSVVSTGTDASTEYISTCFTVSDTAFTKWKVCGLDEATVKHWYCQIKAFLKEEDLVLCPVKDPKMTIIEKFVNITQPILLIPLPSKKCNQNWSYQKDGDDWECDCSEGKEQAPIDLPSTKNAIESDIRPLFQYDRVDKISNAGTLDGFYREPQANAIRLELKENLFRIFHPKFGRIVTMDGAIYYGEEIVLHTPSEHTIEGKKYDMELQIIHYGQSKGDIAKQIVLSFLFERTPGEVNPFLEDLNYFDLPNPTSPSRDIEEPLFIPKLLSRLDDVANVVSMDPFSFFTYQGSLTFPPCTENTIMYVASKPLKIGTTALQLFQEAQRIPDLMDEKGNIIVSDWANKSSRRTQPSNGRPVYHYDHIKYCPPTPERKNEEKGHYEKIRKAMTNYFYVNGNDPSGMPNAYVVSENEALGKGFGPKMTGKLK